MSAETPSGLDAQLLDDFFAEADEHLAAIRRGLLQLEGSVGKPHADAQIVEELFQQFHSFKGISGIVGLAPGEAVAHAAEDFLRSLRGNQAPLLAPGLEALMGAAQKLEQVVGAFRSHSPLPGYESLLADLKQQHERRTPAGAEASSADTTLVNKVEEARARGLLIWKYTFTPSKELEGRGVNINSVREQLAKAGEIFKATPVVKEGVITFEFVVGNKETPTDIAAWETKGVTVQMVEADERAPVPSAPAASETAHNPFLAPSHVVRVDLQRLDELMRITGEMVIQRARLDGELKKLTKNGNRVDLRAAVEVNSGLGRSLRDLREAIMNVRLVPVAEIFGRLPFVVRDLAHQTQKKVRLKIEGQETAIDKYVIERLKDPLLHLIRNALSHGVESPQERIAAQKAEEATIGIRASAVGDTVVIDVADDGRGINPNAIAQRARQLGLQVSENLNSQGILDILCSSGFSTRDDADMLSGRGVGMAVVASTLRELGGSLTLDSEEGRGTRFTLRIPLTLAITDALIVGAAGQTCAIPQSFVTEILHTSEKDLQIVNGIQVAPYRSGVVPVIRLSGLFRLRAEEKPQLYMLIVTSERGSAGLIVESVLGQREIVVRALKDPMIQVQGINGATELGDGKAVLILDGVALTNGSVRPPEKNESQPERN